jgi:predicted RND superfamily exporter protein
VIRELAIAASLGVAMLIFTNLILLPIMLSYTGVSAAAAARSLQAETADAAGQQRHAPGPSSTASPAAAGPAVR